MQLGSRVCDLEKGTQALCVSGESTSRWDSWQNIAHRGSKDHLGRALRRETGSQRAL